MSLTYANMQARIASEFHRTDLTSYITNSIKAAIKHFERERWYFNEATTTTVTVAGTATYALPTDFMKMDNVKVTVSGSKVQLEPMPYIELDALDTGTSSVRGVPKFWAIYGNVLRLYPIPDAVYTITESYQNRLTELSADADTNAWVDDLEALIRTYAKMDICLNVSKDFEQADRLERAIATSLYPQAREENDSRLSSGRLTPYYL